MALPAGSGVFSHTAHQLWICPGSLVTLRTPKWGGGGGEEKGEKQRKEVRRSQVEGETRSAEKAAK